MRTVQVQAVTDTVREMCISVNHQLSSDMVCKLTEAVQIEESPLGKQMWDLQL